MRIVPGLANQMRGLPFDPARLDTRAVHRVDASAQVHDLRGQQPLRRALRQCRTRKNPKAPLARASIIAPLVLARDVGGKAGEEREMDVFVELGSREKQAVARSLLPCSLFPAPTTQQQLPVQLAPLAHPQEGKKMLLAPVSQFRLRQF